MSTAIPVGRNYNYYASGKLDGEIQRDPNEPENYVHSYVYESIDDAESYGIPTVWDAEVIDLAEDIESESARRVDSDAPIFDSADLDVRKLVEAGVRQLAG